MLMLWWNIEMVIYPDDISQHNGIVTTNMSHRIPQSTFNEYHVSYVPFYIKHTLGQYGLWIVYECFCNDKHTVYVHIPVLIFDGQPETWRKHLPDTSITTFLFSTEVFSFKQVSQKDSWSYTYNNYNPKNLLYANRYIFGKHWKELVEGIGVNIIMDYSG